MKPPYVSAILGAVLVALFAAPSFNPSGYLIAAGVSFAVFSVLATGLNLVYGYAGLLSFAQVGFFGIGGYAAAILVRDLGWPFLGALAAGGLLSALVGVVIGYSSLRLSRHAFALVTLSFSLLCMLLARDWVSVTRGAMGMPGLTVESIGIPGGMKLRLDSPVDYYYLSMGFAVLANAVVLALVRSRIGRALRAIKLNEPLAQSQGINPVAYRLLAVVLSAFLAGVVGGIFVFYLGIVDPTVFDFYYTETMLIMVVIGGPGSFWWVLGSTAIVTVLPDALDVAPDVRMVLYGAVLVTAMLVLPGGIGGWINERRVARWRKRSYENTSHAEQHE